MFPPRLRRGTRHPDAPLSPRFAAEERPCDTLRAHSENAARYRGASRLLSASVVQGFAESRRFVGVRGVSCAPRA